MKDKLIIIGASGHGKVIADIAIKMNKWKSISFLDDNDELKTCLGLDVIGRTDEAYNYNYKAKSDFFVAIGSNKIREKVQEDLLGQGFNLVSLIHPSAIIGSDVEIGIGTAIMAGVVINTSTRIGKGCIINTSSSIDHDNIIEDYVHISPGTNLAGTVSLGRLSWLGIGSKVSNNVSICKEVILGAGSVVIKDIERAGTYVGVPARRLIR